LEKNVEKLTAMTRSRTEPASRVERARMLLAYRANSSFFAAGSQEQYLEHTHLAVKTTNLRK
jgi:hypothetical protein